jgi:tubulin polyglutamylase TTLL9
MFLDEMKRRECPWICKPVGGSQGQGIIFVTSEQEAMKFHQTTNAKVAAIETPEDKMRLTYVLQKYIPNPLLVGGRKFDIRLYALTLCFQPLIVYIYRGGFCRFSSQPFSMKNFSSREIHLTNVAVQTHSASYNPRHGGKWDTWSLRSYITNRFGAAESNRVFTAIQGIIMNSLLSVASSVINDKHCYELYGYDIMIADDLRPWLIEINASPSLDANTEDDYDLKFSFLNEMLDLVQAYQAKGDEDLPLHYGGYDLAWNGGPIDVVGESLFTSFIGC